MIEEVKNEWDNYPQETYDRLRSLGWHVHIIEGVVVSAICPNATYIYSYSKGAEKEILLFQRLTDADAKELNEFNKKFPPKKIDTKLDWRMWNF